LESPPKAKVTNFSPVCSTMFGFIIALKPAEVKGNFANGSNNWLVVVKPKDKLASYWGAVKDRSSVEE